MALSFDFPDQPPSWLAYWPSMDDIVAVVPPGIRISAGSILKTEPARKLEWTEDRLSAFFGRHHTAWRLDETGQWRRACSCGYPKEWCVHAYLLAYQFNQAMNAKRWKRPPKPKPEPVPVEEPFFPAPDLDPATATPGDEDTAYDLDLDAHDSDTEPVGEDTPAGEPGETTPESGDAADEPEPDELFENPDGTKEPVSSLNPRHYIAPKRRPGCVRLEVELDRHTAEDAVLARFYRNLGGRRELLRVHAVRDLAFQANTHRRTRVLQEFRGRDQQFLAWLFNSMRSRDHLFNRSPILRLERDMFRAWLSRWTEQPERFIDRASQQFISVDGRGCRASIVFKLNELPSKMVELDAYVVTPGKKEIRFRDLLQQLANGDSFTEAGKFLEMEYNVPKAHLVEFFARKTLTLTRAQVVQFLPTLVNGRLDLVKGKHVHHPRKNAPISIEAKADGASIVLTIHAGGAPVPEGDGAPTATIHHDGGRWSITTHTCPDLGPLRELLRDLPGTTTPEGIRVIPGSEGNVQMFVEFWRALPKTIQARYMPELHPLLGDDTTLQPEFRLSERDQFVDLQLGWRAGALRLSDRDVQNAITRGTNVFRHSSGGWFRINPDAVRELRSGFADFNLDATGFGRAIRPQARRALAGITTKAACATDCADLLKRIREQDEPDVPTYPKTLDPILRDYQKTGYAFLAERAAWKIGAILADDMGLGKTLQVLALLESFLGGKAAKNKKEAQGALVVCPASVVAVWLEQAAKFCPKLRCRAYRGVPESRAALLDTPGWDLIITNYALLRNDIDRFASREFAFVILDEAQQIKNPDALVSQAVRRLRTPRPMALTGTPLENRVLDLWSIMQFVLPGYLGDKELFMGRYETRARTMELSRKIAPFTIRRLKEQVAAELPSRTEEILQVEFDDSQQRFYDARLAIAREVIKSQGAIEILASLTRLRQICCDPRLLPKEELDRLGLPSKNVGSAKLDTLADLADELVSEGHSLLVFSQFTSMLELIRERLEKDKIPTRIITGDTPIPERARIVSEFQESPDPCVMLLSLKAAGTGLTLTKADYVVIYDPWWNPAVERQAIDRTHRIGQTRPVIAYRLVAAGTVEEKMLAMQREKAELFAAVMSDTESAPLDLPSRLTADDLARLLA